MGIVDRRGKVMKLEELIIASLAQTDALSKLLIEKGLITEAEYMEKLSEERATVTRRSVARGMTRSRAMPFMSHPA